MRIDVDYKQRIAWVKRGERALASFAFEEFGSAAAASEAARRYMSRDPIDDVISNLAEWAIHHAVDAPEWGDDDTVQISISIGDLRVAAQHSK